MRRYRKPPIIERALVIHSTLSEEAFQIGAQSWEEKLKEEFPNAETVTEWMLNIKDQDGMPVLASEGQKVSIRQTFWEMHGEQKHRGVQMWHDRIAFNLLSIPDNPHHFEDLEAVSEKWLPEWAKHFGIECFCGVSMEYVNLLSEKTIPGFFDNDGQLMAGQVLDFFSTVPKPENEARLTIPIELQFNHLIPASDYSIRTSVRCHSESPTDVVLQLRFTATTHDPTQKFTLDQIREQINVVHVVIRNQFDAHFTQKAKESFEPL